MDRKPRLLTERRTTTLSLPRAEAASLARALRGVIDVAPSWKRGRYRLTPRGYAGSFTHAGTRWAIRPKLPADALDRLLDAPGPSHTSDEPAAWLARLGDLVADRLSTLLEAHLRPGLGRDYVEREGVNAAVRGRIDFARLARSDPAAGLPFVADEFTPDAPVNQAPKAAGLKLLRDGELGPESRRRLTAALAPLAGVQAVAPGPGGWAAIRPRSETGRELLDWSRTVLADAGNATAAGGFLVNLEQLFQRHLTEKLQAPGRLPAGYAVTSPRQSWASDPGSGRLELAPDLLVSDARGRAVSVWDAKWKSLAATGPLAADAHQALAYALAFGVRTAGLVYPGRRFRRFRYDLAGGVRLYVVQVRLTGGADGGERSLRNLARLARRSSAHA